ncbi:hypothetical protein [Aliiroseovarius sp. F47248L]|uniref:hypothetical protein n=1 Tax=Aliiroseovarius sp. F47248L TaxID=2926420 RepID=UPI001FF385F2|nr:hypothetical protein [Aliiroseovarius sp. F47248L]MCK0140127.1 hypothetical protein [Aliiroseovarius sp. F47248L]
MRTLTLLAVLAGLTACVAPTPTKSVVVVHPDGAGLQVDPVNKRIDFGRSPKGVVPAMDRELGRHSALRLEGCPVGIVQQLQWNDLVLTFTQERFVGWRNGTGRQGQTCA